VNATPIPLGASATRSVVVTRDLTVAHYHPGLPEAYGTPMMIYLMEVAAGEAIASRTVTFAVTAHDGIEPIGRGTHVRAPIELERFNKRLAAKVLQT
jgi:predicted thioesterase